MKLLVIPSVGLRPSKEKIRAVGLPVMAGRGGCLGPVSGCRRQCIHRATAVYGGTSTHSGGLDPGHPDWRIPSCPQPQDTVDGLTLLEFVRGDGFTQGLFQQIPVHAFSTVGACSCSRTLVLGGQEDLGPLDLAGSQDLVNEAAGSYVQRGYYSTHGDRTSDPLGGELVTD